MKYKDYCKSVVIMMGQVVLAQGQTNEIEESPEIGVCYMDT